MEFYGINIETWYLTIPFFFYFGVFFHEISHALCAILTRCSDVKLSFFNEEKNMSVSYNTDSMWKVRFIGLAPTLTAFGVLISAYLTKGGLGWGSGALIFGLLRYSSWSDFFPEVGTGETIKAQETYHRTQRGIRVFIAAVIIWTISSIVAGFMGRPYEGWVVESVGQYVALMSFYYGVWVYLNDNPEPINSGEELWFISTSSP